MNLETEYEGSSLTEINNKYVELTYKIENATNADGLQGIPEELERFIDDGDYLKKSVKALLIKVINQWITDHQENNYTSQNWAAIQTYKNVGIAAINGSSKESLASAAKDTPISNMNSVKTKDEQLSEDRRPYLEAVENAFERYPEEDYSAENWAKLKQFHDNAISVINSADTPNAMETAKNTAIANMNAVQSISAVLKGIKDAAIVEIQSKYKE